MRVLAILLVVCSAGLGQARRYACEPAPEVAAAIRDVNDLRRVAASDLYTKKARELMADVVSQYPDDVFANLRYLSLFREKGHEDVIARYRSAMNAHSEDPRYALFYAASLIGSDTSEALRRLTALTAEPDFPYPYLLIGRIHSYPRFKDHAALSANLIRFVKACPEYLPAYELLAFAGSGKELKPVAERLRKLLSGRADREALVAYRWLWPIEFRVTPVAEHGALRARVEQDLAFLRSRYSVDDPVAVRTFWEGYRSTGNTAALNALPRTPPTRAPVYEAAKQWRRARRLKRDASEEEIEAYYRELAQAARSWIAKWPNEPLPYLRWLQAVAKLPETTEADLVAAGEQLIAINRQRPTSFLTTPAIITVARAYVDRGIRLDDVPRMIETGLRESDARRHAPESDLFDGRNHRLNEEFRFRARAEARAVEFDWALKNSDLSRARNALSAMRLDIDQLFATTTHLHPAQFLDSDYWMKMSQLAELEGRKADAKKYRQTAEERRDAPTSSGAAPSVVSTAGRRLPPFRAVGIDGRLWTAADLDGKVAVMTVWATSCAPCVEELPYFQKLYDHLKDRPNLVVLALNVDRNPGVVAPFLKARSYTFPIVLAHDYVKEFLPGMGIPRNWVVKSGVIRKERIGFSNPDRWLAEMLARVEETESRE